MELVVNTHEVMLSFLGSRWEDGHVPNVREIDSFHDVYNGENREAYL